jgi:NAD+ kinase
MTSRANPPIHRVGIVARSDLRAAGEHLVEIARWLDARGAEAVFEAGTAALASRVDGRATFERDELPRHVDMVLVLGGDGTLLSMADRIAQAGVDVPILGVNFGSLGFLTEVTLPELYAALESALGGTARVDERLMLRAETMREGRMFASRLVLNDVVITKGALSRIIELSVSVGGDFVARFKADGLIIASPTGSTAYNLSAAGPIVHPAVDALVITPIAPHMLANRPIVIPAAAAVQVQPIVEGPAEDEVFVTFDGQWGFQLHGTDLVSVRCAERRLRLIHASPRSYFELLRQKLRWAER